MGVRGVLVYCSAYHCRHWVATSGDRWRTMFETWSRVSRHQGANISRTSIGISSPRPKTRRSEPAGCCWRRLRFSTAVSGLPYATPAALLPDDPIKAAARYTIKYLIFHLAVHPAIPNASAHIVAPHTALGLRIRDTPVAACLVVVGAFRQTCSKSKSLAFLSLPGRLRASSLSP